MTRTSLITVIILMVPEWCTAAVYSDIEMYSTYRVEELHYVFRVFVVVFTPVNVWTLIGENSCHVSTGVDSCQTERGGTITTDFWQHSRTFKGSVCVTDKLGVYPGGVSQCLYIDGLWKSVSRVVFILVFKCGFAHFLRTLMISIVVWMFCEIATVW